MDDVSYKMFFEVLSPDGDVVVRTANFVTATESLPQGGVIVQVERTTVRVSETTEAIKELRKTILED